MVRYKNKEYVCVLDVGMGILRGKWKGVILCHLYDGAKRFLQLQKITGDVSQKVLAQQLKELEEEGLIDKKIYPEVPPRVEYFLTSKGKEMGRIIKEIEAWCIKYLADQVE